MTTRMNVAVAAWMGGSAHGAVEDGLKAALRVDVSIWVVFAEVRRMREMIMWEAEVKLPGK
jgi:hypothetical protein